MSIIFTKKKSNVRAQKAELKKWLLKSRQNWHKSYSFTTREKGIQRRTGNFDADKQKKVGCIETASTFKLIQTYFLILEAISFL